MGEVLEEGENLFRWKGKAYQEAEKRAVAAEERAVVAEKRAAAAEEKILILEKELKKARQWSEADRKATEGRYEGSTGRGWTAF